MQRYYAEVGMNPRKSDSAPNMVPHRSSTVG